MNPSDVSPQAISRRQALQRITLILGGAISAPALAGVLAGCSRTADPAADAQRALSTDQSAMVRAIADHIIPRTDTPGAADVGVHHFVDAMLAEYYPAREREHFLAGLAEVDQRAQREYGAAFLECSPEQQLALVAALDREAFEPGVQPPELQEGPESDVRERVEVGPADSPLPPELEEDTIRWRSIGAVEPLAERPLTPFYRTMKELTLIGYYTSEAGATQELQHEPVPGRYEGCVPLADVGRTWAV